VVFPVRTTRKILSVVGGKSPLHLAVESGNFGVVEELAKAGAIRNIKSDDGETAGALLKKTWPSSSVGVEMRKLLGR
jgi:ankyrin repeat protein